MRHYLRKVPWVRLIKFGLVGGSAFAIDFGLYFILTRFGHLPYLTSRVVSILGAFSWNFMLNRQWTFQAQAGNLRWQATRFTVVMVLTSLLNLGLMRVGVTYLHFHDLVVLIGVSLLIMGINFSAHHFWSYKTIE